MAAEHAQVSAAEWFSGGERLPYDQERASFDDRSPLRVFVRHATGSGTTLTFLPGWPDGSFGWARVDAELAARTDAERLFLDYVGHGDSDKPLEYPFRRSSGPTSSRRCGARDRLKRPWSLPSTTRASSPSSCSRGGWSGGEPARIRER
jgi:pimeloyl-ACP methyl ester carboxylesterase